MSTRKPASLDGSLLARKGSAVPAVPQDSPLTEELGEPRPEPNLKSALRAQTTATVVHLDKAQTPTDGDAEAPKAPERSIHRRTTLVLVVIAVIAAVLFAAYEFSRTTDRTAVHPSTAPAADSAATPATGHAAVVPSVAPPAVPPSPAAVAPAPEKPATVAKQPVESSAETKPPVEGNTERTAAPSTPADVAAPPPAMPAKAPPLPPHKPVGRPPAIAAAPYVVQLAALPTLKGARAEAARLQKRLGHVLDQRRIVTMKAVGADRQAVYRLRAGGYASLAAARDACKRIRRLKARCLVIKR